MAMEVVAKSCYFVWAIKKTFRIFSLRDLRFVITTYYERKGSCFF